MDPVTITTSAVTLIEAAAFITKSLRDFVHGVRTVDGRIAKLCEELENLTTFLSVVDRELKRCQAFDLAIVEDDLWQQSDIVLMDCMVTLIDLKTLIQDIKNTSSSKGFVWRARAMLDLSIHGNELISFQEKIHKSNGALQTILHTINVAFAIRSNANQTVILDELEGLKASVDKAFAISDKTTETFTHVKSRQSDARLARNLRDLARAAENFWVTASSTAGTSHGGRSETSWQTQPVKTTNFPGGLPTSRRQRVERYIQETSPRSTFSAQNVGSLPSSPSEAPSSDNPEVSSTEVSSESSFLEDDDVEEEEFEFMVVEDLQKFAIEKIEQRQLTDAGTSFEDALTRLEKIISGLKDQGGNGHRRYLSRLRVIKIQLATCYFFQGNWKLAEPLVTDLAASKKGRNGVVCNLLHALALSYLSNFSFEIASETCKQAVKGEMLLRKARNSRDRTRDHHQSLGLMATIHEMAGEHPRAEVFRRKLPTYFKYEHPENFQEFLQTHPDFLSIVFGPNPLDFGYIDTTASLQQRQADLDTHKEVVFGPLDDSSPGGLTSRDHVLTLSEFHGSKVEVSLRRRFTKVFKSAKGHAPRKLKKATVSDDSNQDNSYSSNQSSPIVRGWPKRATDRVLNPMKTKVWWKPRLRGRARNIENAGETLPWPTNDSKSNTARCERSATEVLEPYDPYMFNGNLRAANELDSTPSSPSLKTRANSSIPNSDAGRSSSSERRPQEEAGTEILRRIYAAPLPLTSTFSEMAVSPLDSLRRSLDRHSSSGPATATSAAEDIELQEMARNSSYSRALVAQAMESSHSDLSSQSVRADKGHEIREELTDALAGQTPPPCIHPYQHDPPLSRSLSWIAGSEQDFTVHRKTSSSQGQRLPSDDDGLIMPRRSKVGRFRRNKRP